MSALIRSPEEGKNVALVAAIFLTLEFVEGFLLDANGELPLLSESLSTVVIICTAAGCLTSSIALLFINKKWWPFTAAAVFINLLFFAPLLGLL